LPNYLATSSKVTPDLKELIYLEDFDGSFPLNKIFSRYSTEKNEIGEYVPA